MACGWPCIVCVNQLITKEMFSGYDAGILTSYFSLLLRLPYPSEGCQLPIKNIHSFPRQGAHLSANNTLTQTYFMLLKGTGLGSTQRSM